MCHPSRGGTSPEPGSRGRGPRNLEGRAKDLLKDSSVNRRVFEQAPRWAEERSSRPPRREKGSPVPAPRSPLLPGGVLPGSLRSQVASRGMGIYRAGLPSPGKAVKCSTENPNRAGEAASAVPSLVPALLRCSPGISGASALAPAPAPQGNQSHAPPEGHSLPFFPPCEVEKVFLQCLRESQPKKRISLRARSNAPPPPDLSRQGQRQVNWRQSPAAPLHPLGCHGAQRGEPAVTPAGSTLVHWSALSNIPKSKGPERVGQERFELTHSGF